jgi:hypothetical protein
MYSRVDEVGGGLAGKRGTAERTRGEEKSGNVSYALWSHAVGRIAQKM